ncbi:MAG: hypothetical protein GX603_02055 [Chloroflexi bacterium]|nr:hypothetical protein [Chloroflexota bacterium]
MNNKITIIEGPTPEFQVVSVNHFGDGSLNWVSGVMEGPFLYNTAFTNLRTFDAQKLLERCQNTWAEKQTMYLEYKDRIGLRREDPIIAARAISVEEGDLLLLWVRKDLSDEEEDNQDYFDSDFGDDDPDTDDPDIDNFDDIDFDDNSPF